MWILGDWGQDQPWSRASGVKMTKGDDDVYTGELSLPKGTKFDIKILESTISGTSGGFNAWSAVRCASTLNTSASHDFGEFTGNLIPNGRLDEGQVGWTPSTAIKNDDTAETHPNVIELAEGESATSDIFALPTNQTVQLNGYCTSKLDKGLVSVQIVSPQDEVLYDVGTVSPSSGIWKPFRKTIQRDGTPLNARVKLVNNKPGATVLFDSLTLSSP